MHTFQPVPYKRAVPAYPLYLYPFKYRDRLTGKWRIARYRGELHEIQAQHAAFEITGEPIVINGPMGKWFNPAGNP